MASKAKKARKLGRGITFRLETDPYYSHQDHVGDYEREILRLKAERGENHDCRGYRKGERCPVCSQIREYRKAIKDLVNRSQISDEYTVLVITHVRSGYCRSMRWSHYNATYTSRRTAVLAEIKRVRDTVKRMREQEKSRLDQTFGHVTINGYRMKLEDMRKNKDWKVRLSSVDLGPIGPEPHIGVEIECGVTCSKEELRHAIAYAGLSTKCTVVDDSSVTVPGRYSLEIRVCDKQSAIRETIGRTVAVLEEYGAAVDKSCGLHVHLDMRKRNIGQCYSKLYRTLPWLYSMVSESRRSGREAQNYCRRNGPHPNTRTRYMALNTAAYDAHHTLEVRLHHGTVDVEKINRWVELLIRIVDGPTLAQTPKSLWQLAEKLSLSTDLVAYIQKRARYAQQEGLRIPSAAEVL